MKVILNCILGTPLSNQNILNKPDLERIDSVKLNPLLVANIVKVTEVSINKDQITLEEFKILLQIKVTLLSANQTESHNIMTITSDPASLYLTYQDDKVLVKGLENELWVAKPNQFLIEAAKNEAKITLQSLTSSENLLFDRINQICLKNILPLQNQEILAWYKDWQGFFLSVNVNYQIKVFKRTSSNKKRFILVISENPLLILDIFLNEETNPPYIMITVRSKEILNNDKMEDIKQLLLENIPYKIVNIIFERSDKSLSELLNGQDNY